MQKKTHHQLHRTFSADKWHLAHCSFTSLAIFHCTSVLTLLKNLKVRTLRNMSKTGGEKQYKRGKSIQKMKIKNKSIMILICYNYQNALLNWPVWRQGKIKERIMRSRHLPSNVSDTKYLKVLFSSTKKHTKTNKQREKLNAFSQKHWILAISST